MTKGNVYKNRAVVYIEKKGQGWKVIQPLSNEKNKDVCRSSTAISRGDILLMEKSI